MRLSRPDAPSFPRSDPNPGRLGLACLLSVVAGILSCGIALGLVGGGIAGEVVVVCAGLLVLGGLCFVGARQADSAAGLVVAALLLVLYVVPVTYLPVSHQLASALIDPLSLLAAFALVAPGTRRTASPAVAVLIAVLVVAGAAAYAAHPGLSPRFYFVSYLLTAALVYLAVLKGTRSDGDLRLTCRVLMIGGAIASTYGIVEFVLRRNPLLGRYYPAADPNAGGALYFPGTYGYRITTTIGHPLVVASFLLVVLVVAFGVAATTNEQRERWFACIVAVLAFVALVMTKSRAGIVLAPCAVLVLCFFLRRRPGMRRLALLVALAFVGGLAATSSIWLHRFTSRTTASSTDARTLGLSYIERTAPKALPFGLGYGASQARLFSGGVTISSASPENGWAELFIDGGPFVAFALLALPLTGGFTTLRHPNSDPLRSSVAVAGLAVVVDAFTFNGIIVERTFLILLIALAAVSLPRGDHA